MTTGPRSGRHVGRRGPRTRGGRPGPLWSASLRRQLGDPPAFLLMFAVLSLLGVAAAAGPLYVEGVSDAAVRQVLSSVPSRASANSAPLVRFTGGLDVDTGRQADIEDSLAGVPGLGPAESTLQSVSTELNRKVRFDPVAPTVALGASTVTVRLFGVEDPESELVVVARAPDEVSGVWVSERVAADAGVRPGDEVRVALRGVPDPTSSATRVAGVYAVEEDGRTPKVPGGRRLWTDVVADGFPNDAEQSTRRARLVVADRATTEALAAEIGDQLLFVSQARLDPAEPRLRELHVTANAVTDLREELVSRGEDNSAPPVVRPVIASGMEQVSARVDELSAAAQEGAAVASRGGIALALAVVVAAAGYILGRRRREIQHAAGTGRRPAVMGLMYAVELIPAAMIATVVGWVGALGVVALTLDSSTPTGSTLRTAAVWSIASVLVALVCSAVVAAVMTTVESRRLQGRTGPRVPWTAVLVVAAASATIGVVSRPQSARDPLGPLDLLVPVLLAAAVAAVGSRVFFALLRRVRRLERGAPRPTTVVGWLVRRRLQAPDPAREVVTTVATVGLAMLVLSLSSLASLGHTVDDRVAVAGGAAAVDRISSSWLLDPDAPTRAADSEDGSALPPDDVPVARNPPLPTGQSVVWRARTVVAGSQEAANLLIVDTDRIDQAADWGSGDEALGEARSRLRALADEDTSAASALRDGREAPVPALLVGSLGGLDLAVGTTAQIDILFVPVLVVVRAVVPAFPGAGTDQPTLVLPSDSFFAAHGNDDPRLHPRPGARPNLAAEFQSDLWSSDEAAADATLSQFGVVPQFSQTLAEARVTSVYVAAEQARRYQVALGLLLGALGLIAVVLGGVGSARRAPAGDRMLAWVGAGRRAPARARALELVVVLALSAALAAITIAGLHPLGSVLLEPGDDRSPPAVLVVPGVAVAAAATWVVLTWVVSVVAMALATPSRRTVEVLRGED